MGVILKEKWREKSEIKYFINLFMYIVFVVVYTLYVEYHATNPASPDYSRFKFIVTFISLAMVSFNLGLELVQMILYIHKEKFLIYIKQFTNWFELINFPLCIAAILIQDGDLKTAFNSITILFSYIILMTRLDKIYLGRYVKVIGKIARESVPPLFIILILLFGFLFAFRNRASYHGREDIYNYTPISHFNTSLERGIFDIFFMMAGEHVAESMGVDLLTWANVANFFIFLIFMFIMSTLAFNIFTGIAINEIQSLLDDSNAQIMKDKIEYIYDNTVFNDDNILYRKLFALLHKIYLVAYVRDGCLEFFKRNKTMKKVIGKIFIVSKNKGGKDVAQMNVGLIATDELNKSNQLNYSDQRFLENFETIENMIKQNQAFIKGLEDKFKDFYRIEEKINKVLAMAGNKDSQDKVTKENKTDDLHAIMVETANNNYKVDALTNKLGHLEQKVDGLDRADEILDLLNSFKDEESAKTDQLREQVEKLGEAFEQVLLHKRRKKEKKQRPPTPLEVVEDDK